MVVQYAALLAVFAELARKSSSTQNIRIPVSPASNQTPLARGRWPDCTALGHLNLCTSLLLRRCSWLSVAACLDWRFSASKLYGQKLSEIFRQVGDGIKRNSRTQAATLVIPHVRNYRNRGASLSFRTRAFYKKVVRGPQNPKPKIQNGSETLPNRSRRTSSAQRRTEEEEEEEEEEEHRAAKLSIAGRTCEPHTHTHAHVPFGSFVACSCA